MALLFSPYFRASDQSNAPIAGAFLSFYATQTSAFQPIYADVNLTIPLTNPIQSDGNGVFPAIWLDDSLPAYKTVLQYPDVLNPTIPGAIVAGPNGTLDPYNASPSAGALLASLTPENLGTVENPKIPAESALGITPTFYTYPVSPRVDVRRYLSAWDNNSDQTIGLQRAINLAYSQKGRLLLPNGLNVKSGALSLTMSGNRGNQAFAIEGPGWNGAAITQLGTPTALLTISGSTPSGNPSESPLILEGFTLNGAVGNTAIGLLLDGVSMWTLSYLQMSSFGAGIKLSSALLGLIECCQSGNNNYGLLAVKNGAGSGCNSVSVRDCEFNLNATQGILLTSGTDWLLSGIQCEANGTTTDLTTGGIRIAATIDDDIGESTVKMEALHLENNLGQPFQVDNTSGLALVVSSGTFLSGEGHRQIRIQGAANVTLQNIVTEANGIIEITANVAELGAVQCFTLTEGGVVYPFYKGVRLSSGVWANGRIDSFTGTLTAVTGSPTASIVIRQQGDAIWLTIPSGGLIGASSNTTAPTITGLPAKYTPTADRQLNSSVIDNSASKGGVITIGASGVITLVGFGGFTASGSKGLPAITVGPYFL